MGRIFRRLRHRLDWRQSDVAERAAISLGLYSEIERGHVDLISLRKLRRIAAVLEVQLAVEPRWRGGSLDRVLSQRHADMSETVARILLAAGWTVRPEVSFSHFGERGIVDLVAWHPVHRAFLLVELKTELVDVNMLLGVTDRRRRLANVIATSCGWAPGVVGQWVVLADGRTNRRRLAAHQAVIRAAFPSDGRSIAGWLARPASPASALWFLPDFTEAGVRRSRSSRQRVRVPKLSVDPLADPAKPIARQESG